jgi:hypothetical protein
VERVRSTWLLVLGAIVGSSIAAAQPAPAPAHTVPLLVIDAPSTFDLTRLANALDTYVPNVTLAVTAASAGTQPSCDAALAAARAANSQVRLWLHWTADGTLVIERVGEAGCTAIESSTVEVPPEQPAFVYRVVALKVASLVRELPAPAPPPAPPQPVTTITTTTSAVPTSPWRAIDLGASAIASTAAADRVYVASAGAWFGRTWLLGGDLQLGLARDATGAGGDGSVRELGAFVGVRRAIVDRGTWSIDVTAELGVIGVYGSATRTPSATSAMSDDVWTPAAALAPWIRFAVVGPLAIAVGVTLELQARPVELDLGVSPLYPADRFRLRGDVHIELAF